MKKPEQNQADAIKGSRTAAMTKEERAKLEIQAANIEFNQVEQLKERAVAVAKATIATGILWLELCKYIRANAIAPKVVSRELAALGFNKVRISEVNRVANAADEVWNEYEARGLGFRHALELVRNGKPTPILELAFDEKERGHYLPSGTQAAEGEASGESSTEGASPAKDQEAIDAESLARAVKTALQKAAALGVKSRSFSSESHILVIKAKTKAQREKVSASGKV